MKYNTGSIFLTILFLTIYVIDACKKDEPLPCFECISRTIVTLNPVGTADQLPGYPDTIYRTEEICNMTEDQIRTYEQGYGGSLSLQQPSNIYPDGILMQTFFYRSCHKKNK